MLTIEKTIEIFELKKKIQKEILKSIVNDASKFKTSNMIEKYANKIIELKSLLK